MKRNGGILNTQSKRSKSEKGTHCMILTTCPSGKGKAADRSAPGTLAGPRVTAGRLPAPRARVSLHRCSEWVRPGPSPIPVGQGGPGTQPPRSPHLGHCISIRRSSPRPPTRSASRWCRLYPNRAAHQLLRGLLKSAASHPSPAHHSSRCSLNPVSVKGTCIHPAPLFVNHTEIKLANSTVEQEGVCSSRKELQSQLPWEP